VDDKELMQGAYIKAPSRSYTLWENTMCNPLGDMRTQTQSAWHDGYASAKVEKEWQGLTAKDLAEIPPSCYEGAIWADAKLKEKNSD